jgi:hypothetical protein
MRSKPRSGLSSLGPAKPGRVASPRLGRVSERALRVTLYAVAAYQLALGLLMVFAPGTFFDKIGQYGVENDHYIGDVGVFYLAAGIGVFIAAGRPSWRLPMLVVGAIWYGFHALNHLFDIGQASSTGRGILDTVVLALGAAGAAYLANVSARLERLE